MIQDLAPPLKNILLALFSIDPREYFSFEIKSGRRGNGKKCSRIIEGEKKVKSLEGMKIWRH